MQIGWVDFSKDERSKVLSVMDMLSEPEAVDELGIGTIRDSFSRIFFPGVTSIQTRAKYLVLIPYILLGLEQSKETKVDAFFKELDDKEKECARKLLETSDDGVIGSRSIRSGRWVKRKPSDIYWNGLRTYGIFTEPHLSLSEYGRIACAIHSKKQTLASFGNTVRRCDGDENDVDDSDAVRGIYGKQFWKLPEQASSDWFQTLSIDLLPSEARFLKRQIITTCGDSFLGFILKNNRRDFTELANFTEIGENMLHFLPGSISDTYRMAEGFANFIYGAHVRYNVILSQGQDSYALEEWTKYEAQMKDFSGFNVPAMVGALQLRNVTLVRFLTKLQALMKAGDTEGMDALIAARETELKGPARAKLRYADEFSYQGWVGIGKLQYLFPNTRRIVKDIFSGEVAEHAETV